MLLRKTCNWKSPWVSGLAEPGSSASVTSGREGELWKELYGRRNFLRQKIQPLQITGAAVHRTYRPEYRGNCEGDLTDEAPSGVLNPGADLKLRSSGAGRDISRYFMRWWNELLSSPFAGAAFVSKRCAPGLNRRRCSALPQNTAGACMSEAC